MPLGGLAPLPVRLGGTATNGLAAIQHARVAADWLALRRVLPIGVWTYTLQSGVITLHAYLGQNGAGTAYGWTSASEGVGATLWNVPERAFVSPYKETAPLAIRSAAVGVHGTVAAFKTFEVFANGIRVRTFDAAGVAMDATVTVAVY
jgi:hypothetical protein